jgi:hypothetical protein
MPQIAVPTAAAIPIIGKNFVLNKVPKALPKETT